ncbi:MAG: DUF3467 domain-containing protein [Nitrospira sp.]|nr:DUF3467 domain-containing protein [Nitrospira sp.]
MRWDASTIKNAYANVCNVSSTQEEVVLNFGLNQAWERESREMQVQLTNRIILGPFAVKRLALLFGAVVQRYQRQFGELDLTGQAAGKPTPEGSNGAAKTFSQAVT